jgi:hypothetical protein
VDDDVKSTAVSSLGSQGAAGASLGVEPKECATPPPLTRGAPLGVVTSIADTREEVFAIGWGGCVVEDDAQPTAETGSIKSARVQAAVQRRQSDTQTHNQKQHQLWQVHQFDTATWTCARTHALDAMGPVVVCMQAREKNRDFTARDGG